MKTVHVINGNPKMMPYQMENNIDLLIDEVYSSYESENSFQNILHIHPMFYNGTFCKYNSYQPPEPEKLMSKDEFIKKLSDESLEYRWNTALQVLINYKSKENE